MSLLLADMWKVHHVSPAIQQPEER